MSSCARGVNRATDGPYKRRNAQSCVPAGTYRKGDGSVQHFIATSDLSFVSTQKIGMSYTDHPAWFLKTKAP